MEVPTVARSNPVRSQYQLVGVDLVRAGIRMVAGVLAFAREDTGAAIGSLDPRTERWLTSRAVTSAAAKAGVDLNLSALPASEILPFILQDPRAKVRTTEEHIVHMLGGDSPENRAFAVKQVELLEATYKGAVTVAA